jgi:hypothetical protein
VKSCGFILRISYIVYSWDLFGLSIWVLGELLQVLLSETASSPSKFRVKKRTLLAKMPGKRVNFNYYEFKVVSADQPGDQGNLS